MSVETKSLAIILGEILLGVFAAHLPSLDGKARNIALLGIAAMLLLFYGIK